MAQHDLFNRVESSAYSWILDPTVAFVDWFTSDEGLPQEAYQSTVFARLRLRGEADAPSCLMDYLFIWLVEGGASQHCPTYEDWLLTIISITDQLRRGRFGERWTRPLPDGSRPEYRHGDDRDLGEIQIGDDKANADPGRTIDMPLLPAEADLTHPGLNRNVFERVISRQHARDQFLASNRNTDVSASD